MIIKGKIITWKRVSEKLRGIIVRKLRGKPFLRFIYKSYWHSILPHRVISTNKVVQYYTARPNPGAGIGHQMANWHAGLWYAMQFGLEHAHYSFVSESWEKFLGYGIGEVNIEQLKQNGYKIVRLPFFYETDSRMKKLNKDIIGSYAGRRVVFLAEQDQRYDEQYGVIPEIKHRFYNAPSRKNDKILYSTEHYNIAMHVRRGDIMTDQSNPALAMRYLANDYYYKVLITVLSKIATDKEVHIYFFSQGNPKDYPEFANIENLHWCFDMNAQHSFLHMVYADLLITSKSSFSYKPALLSNGVKVCPANFWHSYPKTSDWILFNDEGEQVKDFEIKNDEYA